VGEALIQMEPGTDSAQEATRLSGAFWLNRFKRLRRARDGAFAEGGAAVDAEVLVKLASGQDEEEPLPDGL
jgi:hypothetical protein